MTEPCSQCAQPAVRMIAALHYCHPCAETFLEPIRQRVATREIGRGPVHGIGIQQGPLLPGYDHARAHLQCDVCEATWTGPPGEYCFYCTRWHELAQKWQQQTILHPNLPDPTDERYDKALQAWAKRLAAAELEAVITEHQARAAWKRQVPDVAV